MAKQPAKVKAPVTFKMGDYFTSEKAEQGVQIPLTLPDGTPTADYLLLVGTESDKFRTAQAMAARGAVDIAKIDDEEARVQAVEDARIKVLAACVIGWSFDVECTKANAYELLSKAKYLADLVDRTIGNRALFFGKA